MSVDHLVYVSQAARRLSEADLELILATSRAYNSDHRISGILLYAPNRSGEGGSFMQLLEGEAGEIEHLRERIFTDRRHHTKVVLQRGTKPERCFSDWSMAFRAATPERLGAYQAFAALGEQHFHDRVKSGQIDGALEFLLDFWNAED